MTAPEGRADPVEIIDELCRDGRVRPDRSPRNGVFGLFEKGLIVRRVRGIMRAAITGVAQPWHTVEIAA